MSISMTRGRAVTTGVLAAACALTIAGGVVATAPASAAPHTVAVANPLICQAAMSTSRPKDNTKVDVVVRTKVAGASVHFVTADLDLMNRFTAQLAAQLHVVGRVGEDQVGAARGQGAHAFDAVALDDLIQFQRTHVPAQVIHSGIHTDSAESSGQES